MATGKTGMYSVADLRASRFTSAKEFGLENINQIVTDEFLAHDRQVQEALADFAATTTDALRIYGTGAAGDMMEVDDYGAAPTQKALPGSTVGFPLRNFQYNIGWTWQYFVKATPQEVAEKISHARIADRKVIMREFKKSFYVSANYDFVDSLVDGVTIGVKRAVNADGAAIPAGPNGESYDGATETHYTAEASLTAAGLRASIRNVVEKGHGSRVITAINLADQATVEALTGFKAYVDPRLTVNQNTNQPMQTLDVTRIDNRAIGIFDAAEIWVKPWAIANYAVTTDIGDQEKPLVMRVPAQSVLQGLRVDAQNDAHPIYAQYISHQFGFGVWSRTNIAVHQFSNGTYQDPTIT